MSPTTVVLLVASLTAASCALVGSFLVLRRVAMLGDAISHAVLPGLAVAFLLTGSRDSVFMFAGAACVGLLTAVFTQWIHAFGKVEESASMGVVFTSLFAVGLILIVQAADYVDLDAECVLYGAIETTPLYNTKLFGMNIPHAAIRSGVILLINALLVGLLYKELKLSAFDPTLATTLGFNATWLHYLLMTFVAVTTVASFESVGSILVIAMLIVPPAAAYLLTQRLGLMIILSLVIAAASAVSGYVASEVVPRWFGFAGTQAAGMMAVMAGVIFAMVFIAAPQRGLISRAIQRFRTRLDVVAEDVLGLLYRLEEAGLPASRALIVPALLDKSLVASRWLSGVAIARLRRRGVLTANADALALTEVGRRRARQIIRSHRLWEAYLEQLMNVPAGHVHYGAELLEHVTDADLQARLAARTAAPDQDPHGKSIPTDER